MSIKETYRHGPIQTFFAQQAKDKHIWLLAGSLPIAGDDPNKIRSASILYNDQGESVKRYDKIHLFDVTLKNGEAYRESNTVEAGSEVCVAASPAGQLGLSICYDIRFPGLYDMLRAHGAELVSIPAAFTYTTGSDHWRELVIATAILNQVFVIAANQCGQHTNGRQTFGHSMIVDPWGKVLAEAKSDQPQVVYADIDMERLRWVRQAIPIAEHQRFETRWKFGQN